MLPALKNDRLLRALKRQPVDCTPVWIMRQAGRYLPEYRASRARAGDFLTLCKTPELACEVTLQPIRRFPLDAAILFSDILTIPDAMGLGLSLNEGVGPKFANPVRTPADIAALPELDIDKDLSYVTDAVRLIRRELNGEVPLIGFAGSPWTLMTYMVEGGGSKDFSLVKSILYDDPVSAHVLLQKVTTAVSGYLKAQADAGAQALMVFDTWGGSLSSAAYQEFSLAYMQKIVTALKTDSSTKDIPITLFTKGGGNWLEKIADTGCDCVGLDWTVSISEAWQRVGDRVALQGNMDPSVLYASADKVAAEAASIIREFGNSPGHIFNLGHGIHPGIDPEKVGVLVNTVHKESSR
ncbi:MAG: uroporphyrinogen decarboxylase [Arenicellales bacterium]